MRQLIQPLFREGVFSLAGRMQRGQLGVKRSGCREWYLQVVTKYFNKALGLQYDVCALGYVVRMRPQCILCMEQA